MTCIGVSVYITRGDSYFQTHAIISVQSSRIMANFSEAFAEAINSIADELERLGTDGEKKLKRMISFLQLQGKLNPQEGEEISGFSELVERLWQHECIHAGDVSLLEKTLKTVGLEECARRLSNCPSVCAELNTKNIYGKLCDRLLQFVYMLFLDSLRKTGKESMQ